MKPSLLLCFLIGLAPLVSADTKPAPPAPAVRKAMNGKPMSAHQIAVENLAKKAFGKDFQYIAHTEEGGVDNLEVTCHVALDQASAPKIQNAIKEFARSYYTSGFKADHFAVAYETRVPDGLGNDKLTALVNARVKNNLVDRVNWKSPDKVKFQVLFSSSVNVPSFLPAWQATGS